MPRSYIENQRKQELTLWANHIMKPKRYNIIAQFSIIDKKVKSIFTGLEIIYPDEKRNITKSYNEKEFFLNIRNNTLMAGPVYDIQKSELNIVRFRKKLRTYIVIEQKCERNLVIDNRWFIGDFINRHIFFKSHYKHSYKTKVSTKVVMILPIYRIINHIKYVNI